MEELIDKASSFYTDVFTLEWKKMILPVIMVLALSASAYSTLDLRDSPQSEERMELSVETMTNLTDSFLRTDYFNESVNKSARELSQEISREAKREEKQLTSGSFRTKSQVGQIQKLGLFPLTPELYAPVPAGREDAVSTLAVIHYRQSQFEELNQRLNSSENMSLEQFNSEIERIRDSSWKDEEVQNFLENYTLDENTSAGALATSGEIREKMRTGKIQELGFMSYLPAILATFLLYYVINALAVETGRKAYIRIRNREDGEFEENSSEKEKDAENGQEENSRE